jgi:hypothetical protein
MTAARRDRTSRRVPPKPYLPSAPLADAVLQLAARYNLKTVCVRAGIPERVVTRWRLGEQGGRVDLDLADQVMTRLGLFWWDIWTAETVREPLFLVTTYNTCLKKEPGDKYRRRRLKDRTIPYGDLGTDFYRLREIETLMSGSLEVAA